MTTWKEWLEAAHDAWVDGRFGDALQFCDRAALMGEEARYRAAMVRGDILLDVGDAAGALSSYETVADPDVPDPLIDCARGQALFQLARFAEADNALRSAIAGRPDLAEAHFTLGVISELTGTGEESRWYRNARKYDPHHYPSSPRLAMSEFEKLVGHVVETLPQAMLDALAEVPILITDLPRPRDLEPGQPTVSPTAYGALVGLHPADPSDRAPGRPAFLLFKRNIERACSSRDELESEIRKTLTQELQALES